jgi:hypothetical protein
MLATAEYLLHLQYENKPCLGDRDLLIMVKITTREKTRQCSYVMENIKESCHQILKYELKLALRV